MKYIALFSLILFRYLSFAQTFDTEAIFQSGTDFSRINLVILSDGYTEIELDQFMIDATNFSDALFAETPYKEYKNYFNVYAIKVPSAQSGASHPGTATDVDEPQHPVLVVDNYFESTFDAYDIHRLLVSNDNIVTSTLANNFPFYDMALVLVNSPYYGGSGGGIAVSSLHSSSNDIAIHELGHSFGGLADEYYAGDIYFIEGINMTQETDPSLVKWKNWMGINDIGIYQHCCGGESEDWYRPHQECKMRYLSSPFCSVCIEGTIERIHSLVSSVASIAPNASSIDLSNPVTFELELIEPIPNSLNVEWSLNGIIFQTDTNSITISSDDLLSGSNTLQVTVIDNSTLLKVDNHETVHFRTILWNIDNENLSTNIVVNNSLKIELYPNPTQDVLNFNLTTELQENYTVSIIDLSGKQLITKDFNHLDEYPQISLNELPSGVYLINFSFGNRTFVTSKIVKK